MSDTCETCRSTVKSERGVIEMEWNGGPGRVNLHTERWRCADPWHEGAAPLSEEAPTPNAKDWMHKSARRIADWVGIRFTSSLVGENYETRVAIIAEIINNEFKSVAAFSEEEAPTISLEVYQHDWIPGFAAFHSDGERADGATKHVVLNVGSLMSAVQTGDLDKKDLPYMIAESLMHETVHALEEWAGVEFSEDRVEALLEKYRQKYERATIWEYTGSEPKEESAAFSEEAPTPVNTTTSTAEDRNLACSTDESCSEDGVMATQIGTGKPIAAQLVGGPFSEEAARREFEEWRNTHKDFAFCGPMVRSGSEYQGGIDTLCWNCWLACAKKRAEG